MVVQGQLVEPTVCFSDLYMTSFYKIRSKYKAKSLDHEIQVTVTSKWYEDIDSVRLNKYPKYDAFLFERVGDTRQNHRTMKYRSQ